MIVALLLLLLPTYNHASDDADLFPLQATLLLPTTDSKERVAYNGKFGSYTATLESVMPILELAIADVAEHHGMMLPEKWIEFTEIPMHCKNQSKLTSSVLKSIHKHKPNIVFGPACDFAVATVSRILNYYDVPLVTPAAFSNDFRNVFDYKYVTRTYSIHDHIVRFVLAIFGNLDWQKFKFIYQVDFEIHEMMTHDFCKNLGNEFFSSTADANLSVNFEMYRSIHKPVQVEEYLSSKVGYAYSGKVLYLRE